MQQERRLFLLLQKCRSLRKLYKIHALIILNGFSQKSSLLHKLLSCCITHGELAHASLAFEQSVNPSTTVWNQIIRGFSKSKTPHQAILLYSRFIRTQSGDFDDRRPNGFTYSFLLNACSNPFLLREGLQFHCGILVRGFLSSVYVQTNLINMYAIYSSDHIHLNGIGSARKVFDNISHKNVAAWNSMLVAYVRWSVDTVNAMRLFDRMPERDVFSWTTVIAACARSGRSKQAVVLFQRMYCAGVTADQVTMVSVLSACADLGDFELGRRIHSWVMNNNNSSRRHRQLVSLDNALINMYVKCGAIDEAYSIFQNMAERSVVSWTTMITGLVVHGQAKRAMEIFQQMQQSRESPDETTFIGVLCACNLMRRPDEGLNYFNYMTKTYNIKPTVRHFSCIVDMLSKAGRIDEAVQIIEADMLPIQPNEAVWSCLLSGCRIHGDFHTASLAGRRLLELEQQQEGLEIGGQLAQLSNLYIGFGAWDEGLQLRRRMVESGMRKLGGRSWIVVHGVVHEFMAGDQNKKRFDNAAVYDMVREIVDRAKTAGYKPKTSEVMLDVEEEERELFLLLHSEKLAMAFGLISFSDKTTPIRIVTNLRVCSDCHSFAEFISRSFNREIIIRERNRFHHFHGTTCRTCNCK